MSPQEGCARESSPPVQSSAWEPKWRLPLRADGAPGPQEGGQAQPCSLTLAGPRKPTRGPLQPTPQALLGGGAGRARARSTAVTSVLGQPPSLCHTPREVLHWLNQRRRGPPAVHPGACPAGPGVWLVSRRGLWESTAKALLSGQSNRLLLAQGPGFVFFTASRLSVGFTDSNRAPGPVGTFPWCCAGYLRGRRRMASPASE